MSFFSASLRAEMSSITRMKYFGTADLVSCQRDRAIGPEDAAVLANVALLERETIDLSSHEPLFEALVGVGIVRMMHASYRPELKLLRGVTDHLAKFPIHGKNLPIQRAMHDPHGCVIERSAKALLQLSAFGNVLKYLDETGLSLGRSHLAASPSVVSTEARRPSESTWSRC